MSKVGRVYRFRSKKASGYESRNKFHIAIALKKGIFLFICSDPFEGAMKIDRIDWPEMPNTESYISFSSTIQYSKSDLEGFKFKSFGRLSDDCLSRLYLHSERSITLTGAEVDILLDALKSFAPD